MVLSTILADVILLCSGATPTESECRIEMLECLSELQTLELPSDYDNRLEICIESWEIRNWEKKNEARTPR